MGEFSLWINVIGGGEGERPLVNSESPQDIIDAVNETADEVDNDENKYYELNTPDNWCYTFPTSAEIIKKVGRYI